MERGCAIAVTPGTLVIDAACSSVAAGRVGSSTAAPPDMSGHQHGAWVPAPWCIDAGIAS